MSTNQTFILALYIYNGTAYIPTNGKEPGGPFLEIDPVVSIPLTEEAKLRDALLSNMQSGHPRLSHPFPKYKIPVVVQAMWLKSWSSMVKLSYGYHLRITDGKHCLYFCTKGKAKGVDPERIELPSERTDNLSVINFVIEHIHSLNLG